MRRVDVIAGSILTVIGLAAWFEAAALPTGTLRYLGPGMMPAGLAVILVAVGLLVLIGGIIGKSETADSFRASARGSVMIGLALAVFAATIAGVDIGAIAIPPLGLVVAGPLAVLIAGYATPGVDLREICALAFGFTAGCTAVFNDLLGLDIPVLPDALQTILSDWVGWDMAPRVAYVAYAVIAALILVFLPRSCDASEQPDRSENE
jgi:hypothetical protein